MTATHIDPVAIIEMSSVILNRGSVSNKQPITTMVVREVACHIVGSSAANRWVARFPKKNSFNYDDRATISVMEKIEHRSYLPSCGHRHTHVTMCMCCRNWDALAEHEAGRPIWFILEDLQQFLLSSGVPKGNIYSKASFHINRLLRGIGLQGEVAIVKEGDVMPDGQWAGCKDLQAFACPSFAKKFPLRVQDPAEKAFWYASWVAYYAVRYYALTTGGSIWPVLTRASVVSQTWLTE